MAVTTLSSAGFNGPFVAFSGLPGSASYNWSSRSGTSARVATPFMIGAVPISSEPILNFTEPPMGFAPAQLYGVTVAVKVTLSLYCWLDGATVTVRNVVILSTYTFCVQVLVRPLTSVTVQVTVVSPSG